MRAQIETYTREEVAAIYGSPLPELMIRAMVIHRQHHDPLVIQHCTLANIKAGGCPEDCAYCPQSAHYNTGVRNEKLAAVDDVLAQARAARDSGSTRFCMGASWRSVRDDSDFEDVLSLVRQVREMGMEACVTLGMLTREQAIRLKEAGLTSYNHNLDTSPEFYGQIVTTRTYADRLETLQHIQEAGIEVCCGGILGMGESRADRVALLTELANLSPQPHSVPINALVPVEGTPLQDRPVIDAIEMVRAIATARILMPHSRVRLAAGRANMTDEAQALCFLAGANSIFTGEKLLTTPNPGCSHDDALLDKLGLAKMR